MPMRRSRAPRTATLAHILKSSPYCPVCSKYARPLTFQNLFQRRCGAPSRVLDARARLVRRDRAQVLRRAKTLYTVSKLNPLYSN
jgi:hypothetical protein